MTLFFLIALTHQNKFNFLKLHKFQQIFLKEFNVIEVEMT